jgi:uncharacterized RDD family membrane protein YckC
MRAPAARARYHYAQPNRERPMLDTTRALPTPEGIEIVLRLAGPVPRAFAWLIDFALRLMTLILAAWVLSRFGGFGWGTILLVAFALEWLAPAAFEAWADGATPGKRALGIMVLHDDGTPVAWTAALVRNLLRAVDFLPVGYGFGLMAMLMSRDFKRLGDITAGTVVVYREARERATAIPPANPMPAVRALTLIEQRTVLDFAERVQSLTPERAREIAEIARPITGATYGKDTERLIEVANFLSGRRV